MVAAWIWQQLPYHHRGHDVRHGLHWHHMIAAVAIILLCITHVTATTDQTAAQWWRSNTSSVPGVHDAGGGGPEACRLTSTTSDTQANEAAKVLRVQLCHISIPSAASGVFIDQLADELALIMNITTSRIWPVVMYPSMMTAQIDVLPPCDTVHATVKEAVLALYQFAALSPSSKLAYGANSSLTSLGATNVTVLNPSIGTLIHHSLRSLASYHL